MNTAQDLVAYLLAATGGGAQDGEHHAVRQAVLHGVREVMQCRQWLWHTRTGSFTTSQISTTGTITQGSKNITVANATGFVPGRVVAIGAAYFPTPIRIASVNGNVVTVDVPASQSGSGVTIQPQTYFDLPPDLKDVDALVTNTVGTMHTYISPQEWQRLEINTRGSGEPYYYTVMRSDLHPDRYQVRFVGVPVTNTVVHYSYRIIPQPVKYMGYERICRQGTVQLSQVAGVPTVTGTDTIFPADCAGCYIRFGSAGMEADAAGSNFPFLIERRIEQWNSATSLRVSTTTVATRTNAYSASNPAPALAIDQDSATLPALTKYAITDVIDASPQMYTAVLSAVEMWYARLSGKSFDAAMTVFNRDLRIAMENDVLSPASGRHENTWFPTPRSMGWHSPMRQDVQ